MSQRRPNVWELVVNLGARGPASPSVYPRACGPECTVGGTIFEMWLWHYEPTKAFGPKS